MSWPGGSVSVRPIPVGGLAAILVVTAAGAFVACGGGEVDLGPLPPPTSLELTPASWMGGHPR